VHADYPSEKQFIDNNKWSIGYPRQRQRAKPHPLRPPAGFIRAFQSDTGLDPPDSADSLSPPKLEALDALLKTSFVSSIVFHSVREG
jgi:hypothetical protein